MEKVQVHISKFKLHKSKILKLKIPSYAKIHSKNPDLKIHQVQFSNKEPFRCLFIDVGEFFNFGTC